MKLIFERKEGSENTTKKKVNIKTQKRGKLTAFNYIIYI